jgi:hypothetical protein
MGPGLRHGINPRAKGPRDDEEEWEYAELLDQDATAAWGQFAQVMGQLASALSTAARIAAIHNHQLDSQIDVCCICSESTAKSPA